MKEKDIFERLTQDHNHIQELLKHVDMVQDRDERARRYNEVRAELKAHAAAEEAMFYPHLRQNPQTLALAREGMHDHAEMDKLMYELDSLDIYDQEWLDATRDLRECFKHHVRDEESRDFPKLRPLFDERAAYDMGTEFARVRQVNLHAA